MQRLDWIDRMRGFAILSVVIQHMTMSFTNDFVYLKIIGIANMGLFFFISGYLMVATCRWTALPDMAKFCRKKLRALMIPFVTWGILMPAFAFQTAWHPITLDTIVTEWHHPHLWFLLTLMGYSLLFAVYRFTVSHVRHAKIIGGGNSPCFSDCYGYDVEADRRIQTCYPLLDIFRRRHLDGGIQVRTFA